MSIKWLLPPHPSPEYTDQMANVINHLKFIQLLPWFYTKFRFMYRSSRIWMWINNAAIHHQKSPDITKVPIVWASRYRNYKRKKKTKWNSLYKQNIIVSHEWCTNSCMDERVHVQRKMKSILFFLHKKKTNGILQRNKIEMKYIYTMHAYEYFFMLLLSIY